MKSRLFHIFLLLLLAQSVVAQRDIFSGQIMAQGGVIYFSDQIGEAETPNAYGAGLRLMGNAGRSWQIGLSYLESRYWDDSDQGVSFASISVGYAWDNGYLLRERAFLSPYHLIDVGYLSFYRPNEESPFKTSQGVVGFENGFKFRFGDRISARLGLGLYWRADDEEFKGIFENSLEYGYKAGLSFYFGERKSDFRGPVFNAGREFEQRRSVMRIMEEQGIKDLSALPLEAQLKIRTTPLIDTLTIRRPEISVIERPDTTYIVRTDTLYLVDGDTLDKAPEKIMESFQPAEGDSTFVQGASTSDSTLVRTAQKSKVDTLFTEHRDTVYTMVRDTVSIFHTDTLYLFEGDTLTADSLSAAVEVYRQNEEAKLRKEDAERKAMRPDTVYIQERTSLQGRRDTVVAYSRPDQTPQVDQQKETEYTTSDLLRRQNELIETQNNLIRALLQHEQPEQTSQQPEQRSQQTEQTTRPAEQTIIVQQPNQSSSPQPRLEVVPQVAIPLGGGHKKSDDDQPTNAEIMARLYVLEAAVASLKPAAATDTTQEKPYTYSRDYAAFSTADTTSAQKDTLAAKVTPPDTLDRSTTDAILAPQPGEDSLKALKPDTASINGAQRSAAEDAKTEDETGIVPTVKPALQAEYPVVVLFGLNRTNFDAEYRSELDQVVADLSSDPNLSAVLTGFTDASGQADYNLMLSNKRAGAVKTYLVEHGISPERVTIEARGKTEATRTYDQNERRVEITLRGK